MKTATSKKYCSIKSVKELSDPYPKPKKVVEYTAKEKEVLALESVKKATSEALNAWKSIKRNTAAFARKLSTVRTALVNGRSPRSLFSKWLKANGIPRATAYWTLAKYSSKKPKQPNIKRLLKSREDLQLKLSKASKDERADIKTQLESVKKKITAYKERLEAKMKAISKELEALITASAVFNEKPESKPLSDDLLGYMQDLGLITHVVQRKSAPVYSFKTDGTVSMSIPEKKPAASVRATAQRPAAQPQA